MEDSASVHRLTPSRRDDFLRFFDHERGAAFRDNPGWAKCYCHYYHMPKAVAWEGFDGPANRTAMAARMDAAEMDGFLAYAGSAVVGWLNAQPVHKLPHCTARMGISAPPLDVPPCFAAAIVCFVIDPHRRRRGIARSLLDAALASFATRGIRVVDAFPFKAGDSTAPADHYHGPPSLFREAGFEALSEHEHVIVMRKRLVPAG
jgi:ribosomal protein S18 acetylase RimI-like enzyme